MASQSHAILLRPSSVAKLLAVAIGVLLALHAISQVVRFAFGRESQMGFAQRVYFGSEASLPAWFTASVILACAFVLFVIARGTWVRGRGGSAYWAALGVIFVVMSADEAAALHEMTSPVFAGTMRWLGESVGGLFATLAEKPGYAWVIPGTIVTLAIGVGFLRFFLLLPPRSRALFITAGAVYVAGALGLELVGGRYSALHGSNTVGFVLILTLEETLEMVGMSVFLYALVRHVQSEFGSLHLQFEADPPMDAREAA